MIFRIDDISLNTDIDELEKIIDVLKFNGHDVMLGFSPCCSSKAENGRVFPKIHSAMSDNRIFFEVDRVGIPHINRKYIAAGHGIVHADHRLLNYAQQELSIITSCALCNSKIFIPPFNKWNNDTEDICIRNGIDLIKFEEGWLSCEHNKFIDSHDKWYFHAHCFGLNELKAWIG
jgi:hypothetical protein